MEEKTNVMRILDQKKVPYQPHTFTSEGAKSGLEIAAIFGLNPARVFKTLVTVGKSGTHYCFVIPAENELDLKKAASAVKEKSIEMIKSKELLPLTGYIHGGCSPIGMKKFFRTVFHQTAPQFDTIIFSAGKIGFHVEMSFADLQKVIRVETADLTVEEQADA
ncbi:MAG TPA: Cys-tRNA(Pro) deacylase [Ruminococcaceae bacterium]|nr:Cys-tRNA(Pro) deacylase [Oscillospiraceae bacterium]